MSILVEKVKAVVNSNRRKSESRSRSSEERISSDRYARTSDEVPAMPTLQRGRAPQNDVHATTRQFAAMIFNDDPVPVSRKPLPPPPNHATRDVESTLSMLQPTRPLPGQPSAPQVPTHRRNISVPVTGSQDTMASSEVRYEVVPDRISSLKVSRRSGGGNGSVHPKNPGSSAVSQKRRSIDVAPGDPSPLIPYFSSRSQATYPSPSFDERKNMPARQNLHLPENFDLGNSEHTYVDTTMRPAVTHEVQHRQRTEIVTQAVYKDVHVHHYFTYIQPIKVTEILPAKHYKLGEHGEKIQIPAPEDFQLPAHLKPNGKLLDSEIKDIKKTTRHYIVDNENPNGKLLDNQTEERGNSNIRESPPLRHSQDIRRQTSAASSENKYSAAEWILKR